MDVADRILAAKIVDKLDQMIPQEHVYSGNADHFKMWKDDFDKIPKEWFERIAAEVLSEAEEPSQSWGMTRTRMQKLMLPPEDFKRLRAEQALNNPKSKHPRTG